jgi:uncharacterized membrane protein YkvA (DUF1232 family)
MSPSFSGARRRSRAEASRREASRRAASDDLTEVRSPRSGARRTVMGTIRLLPSYLRLLGGLMTDRRVSAVDKVLVGLAIAYIVMPFDLIPDIIPFLGEVDDVFLLMLAMQRLLANAGRDVLEDHWRGDPEDLDDLNVKEVMGAAAFFLPGRIKRSLTRMAGGLGRRKRRSAESLR